MSMPSYVAPMLATLGSLPLAGRDEDWVYEKKWDGVRTVVHWDGAELKLWSRNEIEMTVGYPELAALGGQFGDTPVMLDGEIVALDRSGRASFTRLQRRMHVSSAPAAERLATQDPAVLMVFDVLYLDGHSLLDLPWADRRHVLETLELSGESWQTPAAMHGTAAEAYAESKREELEGVVAKRRDGLYRPGRRSPDWIKLKNIRTQEAIVGGWREGTGNRAGTIGALLLGLPASGGKLDYIGRVGTGFTQAVLADLMTRFAQLGVSSSPFTDIPRVDAHGAHWLSPSLVGEVAFSEWTTDDRLRHPAWRGLRPDKSPADVVRES